MGVPSCVTPLDQAEKSHTILNARTFPERNHAVERRPRSDLLIFDAAPLNAVELRNIAATRRSDFDPKAKGR
jgi:hypothetical protein